MSVQQWNRTATTNTGPASAGYSVQLEEVRKNLSLNKLFHSLGKHRDWTFDTAGPGLRTEGLLTHIAKESDEIRKDPTDRKEWIDIILLGMDGYYRTGGTHWTLIEDLIEKIEKILRRKWAKVSGDQPMEHTRGIHD